MPDLKFSQSSKMKCPHEGCKRMFGSTEVEMTALHRHLDAHMMLEGMHALDTTLREVLERLEEGEEELEEEETPGRPS